MPVRHSLIHHLLEGSARVHPRKTAVVHQEHRLTYLQLNAEANRLAQWCLAQSLEPGDRVSIMMENGPDYIVAYYGALKAGAVVVPLSSTGKPDSAGALLRSVRPRLLVASGACSRTLRAADLSDAGIQTARIVGDGTWKNAPFDVQTWRTDQVDTAPSDPCLALDPCQPASIIFTSGSSGVPKGVVLTHRNIVANTQSICESLALTAEDCQMVVLPFHYVMGKSLLNTHIAVGGTVVLNNTFAYPATVLRDMEREGVTGFSGVPSTYGFLLSRSPLSAYRDRLPSLRYCAQAGGHMSAHVKRALVAALPPHTGLYVMYGATEASARLTCLDATRLEEKIESIGTPIPDVSVRILDGSGRELPPGAVGELVASGPNIMQGYWQDPEGSAKVLLQGSYHTGDLGYRDAEGFLYVTGRRDNQLKVRGHRVNPIQVEDALLESGLVDEVAVIGVEDGLQGHRLVALVAPATPELTVDALMRACAGRLPRHLLPATVRFVRTIPKMASGKFDLTQCRALVD